MKEFNFAGRTILVTDEQYLKLTDPAGWGDLSISELEEMGIHPSRPGSTDDPQAVAVFRPPHD